ncbi:MAG: hypothetical protein BGN92_12930 [Sphingobacteriales bacterium 41-5]|nr:MAG: hypothetical protein BGN92_12930 [Sphingobacteriales bacterium 41-5]
MTKEKFQAIDKALYKHRFLMDLPRHEVDETKLYYVTVRADGLPTLAPKGEGISLFGVELLEILRY